MYANQQVKLAMAEMSNDGLVTVDQGGCVRLWETALVNLDQSLRKWRTLIGEGEKPLQVYAEIKFRLILFRFAKARDSF